MTVNNYHQQIIDTIWAHTVERPDHIAVCVGSQEMTYGELGQQTEALCQEILTELHTRGLSLEDNLCAGVCMERNSMLVPAILALLRLGITYVPLSPMLPQERIDYIADDCGMAFVLTPHVSHLPSTAATTPLASAKGLPSPASRPTSYIIYTSGTTGQPKGVMIPYSALYALLSHLHGMGYEHLSPESRMLCFASITFDASIIEIFGSLYYGATMILASDEERTDAKLLYRLMTEQHVTYALLPPSLLAVFPSFEFPSLEALFVGGEPMLPVVADRAQGHGYRLINIYGPTENTVCSTMRVLTPKDSCQNIGHTFAGIKGYVVDEAMQPVDIGQSGELLLGGPQLASGYLNHPELTAKAFVPNPFKEDAEVFPILYHTGDLVRQTADGSYEYISRTDAQVKLHGYRIELGEITHHIEEYPGVVKAFVRIEESGNDKQLVAYVQTNTPEGPKPSVLFSALKQNLRRFLPYYMVPGIFVPVQQFELTVNGKIDTGKLPSHADARHLSITTRNETLTAEETLLESVIARMLDVPTVDIDINLIDELGMSSLQILQVISNLDFTGFHVSSRDFLQQKTIRKIAAHHEAKSSYWFNTPDKGKPTMIVVSGYTSFDFLYTVWAQAVSDCFNIFVVESYHEAGQMNILDTPTLVEKYYEWVKPIVAQYGCDVITGFCLGGELGLYLAHLLDTRDHLQPHVVVMDGEVDRGPEYREMTPVFIFPNFTPEINMQRFNQDMCLVESTPDFRYRGPLTSLLSQNFDDSLAQEFNNVVDDKYLRFARSYFDRAADYWRRRYPECEIAYVDTDHNHYLLDENSKSFLISWFKEKIYVPLHEHLNKDH